MSSYESFWRRVLREIKEIEEEFERVFEEISTAMIGPPVKPMWSTDGVLEPLINVHEEDDKYIITIDLPYGDMKSLSVTGEENKITVSCRLKRNVKFEKWGTVQRCTEFKEYRKTILMPDDADVTNFSVEKLESKCIVRIVVPRIGRISRRIY